MLKWFHLKHFLSVAVSLAFTVSAISAIGFQASAEGTTPNSMVDFSPFFTTSSFIKFNQDGGKADKWGQLANNHIWWTWSQDADNSWAHNVTLDTDNQCEGSNSVKFVNSGTTKNTHADVYFALQPSHTYTFSVYVKTDGALGGQDTSSGIYVNYSLYTSALLDAGLYDSSAITAATLVKDSSLADIKGKKIFQNFEDWTQLKVTVTTPANTGVGMIGLYQWNNTGRTYFSNIKVMDGAVDWSTTAASTTEATNANTTAATIDSTSETIATVPQGGAVVKSTTAKSTAVSNPNTSDNMPSLAIVFAALSVTGIAIYGLRKTSKKKSIQ
jgi:hypothetical protein